MFLVGFGLGVGCFLVGWHQGNNYGVTSSAEFIAEFIQQLSPNDRLEWWAHMKKFQTIKKEK